MRGGEIMESIQDIIQNKVAGKETSGYRTNLVIFLSERRFNVKDKKDPDVLVPLVSWAYYDTVKHEAGELTLRVENVEVKGADKIVLKKDGNFIEYAITKKEVEWSGGINLDLQGVSATGRKFELRQIAVL